MNFKPFFIVLVIFAFLAFGLPKHLQKKINKEIKSNFNVESFTFNAKVLPQEVTNSLPAKFGTDNLFEIVSNDSLLGYAYVAKAPSKTDEFDYLVLLDPDLIVLKAKVLVYREDYGGEIGSKRWLKQFKGKTQHDELRYNDNIMAISGATISVRSMTRAMNNLLQSLKILHEKQIL